MQALKDEQARLQAQLEDPRVDPFAVEGLRTRIDALDAQINALEYPLGPG